MKDSYINTDFATLNVYIGTSLTPAFSQFLSRPVYGGYESNGFEGFEEVRTAALATFGEACKQSVTDSLARLELAFDTDGALSACEQCGPELAALGIKLEISGALLCFGGARVGF